jgi:hypothetical protein
MRVTFRSSALIAAVRDAWPVQLALGGIAFASALGVAGALVLGLAATSPAAVRYAGTTLEVLGIATVAVGLREVRKRFGRPSFRQEVLAWFQQIAAVFGPPKAYGLRAEVGGIAITGGKARLVHRAGPGASLESRVAILEEGLERLPARAAGMVIHGRDGKGPMLSWPSLFRGCQPALPRGRDCLGALGLEILHVLRGQVRCEPALPAREETLGPRIVVSIGAPGSSPAALRDCQCPLSACAARHHHRG